MENVVVSSIAVAFGMMHVYFSRTNTTRFGDIVLVLNTMLLVRALYGPYPPDSR